MRRLHAVEPTRSADASSGLRSCTAGIARVGEASERNTQDLPGKIRAMLMGPPLSICSAITTEPGPSSCVALQARGTDLAPPPQSGVRCETTHTTPNIASTAWSPSTRRMRRGPGSTWRIRGRRRRRGNAAIDRAALPRWRPGPAGLVLVVSPHPDDETVAVGGLLHDLVAAGWRVRLVSVTDGEAAYPAVSGLGAVRRRELASALDRLGIADATIIHRLALPDGHVAECQAALEARPRTPRCRSVMGPGPMAR